MKRLLFVVVAGGAIFGFADTRYWGASSGNWHEPTSWKYGVPPQVG